MKRLLHRSKGDKKPENGSTSSAAAAKKTWTTSAGLGALQQSRARSGSNPQIRHLAMESHEGPVTKATMDDIRREATSNGSNLQINTFSFSAADINNSSEAGFASAPVAGVLESNINAATSDTKRKAQSRPQFRAVGSVALGSSVSQPATAPIDASVSADFPPRTTSVVLMSGLPPRIDTKVATAQKDRAHAVKSTSADARDPTSAFTEDSDVSLALGASAVDSGGFDPPIYLRQPQNPQQQPPSPPMSLSSVSSHHSQPSQPATEGGKRVISEKIKKLAHRFSNSSLKEKHDIPVPPPAPQAISRRPSYSPSVSERVSLFDGHDFQTSSDPRISLRTEQVPADPTGAAAAIKCNTSNSTISPIGTRMEKYGSLRRAGAVVPIPANGAVSDAQRSASTSNGYVADPQPFERSIPLSQPATSLAPALSTTFAGTRRLSVDDLHTDTDTNLADVETYKITKDTLVSNLKRKSACTANTAGYGYLDSVLVKATNADVPPEDPENDMGRNQSYSIKTRVTAALMAVEGVLKGVDNSKVLSSAEYERYSLEAASLKCSLQSARARLALEIRMRDAAKNLVDLRRGSSGAGVSMFKGKHSHQTQLDEYNQANEKVQQIEIEVTELSTKLRLLELGIHGHQLAILSSAIRTVVSESADTNEQAQAVESSLELRVASLEKQINDNSLEHSLEKEKLLAEHLATRQELEQQIRDLQNKNHETITRFASKGTNSSDNESQISHHSANLAVERLTGEITVLKEQNQDALQLARVLEAKLDEAHLKTQETQNELDELRSQASDVAEISRIQLEFAREEARLHGQCTQAFATGVRSIVGPLRILRDAQDNVEKLRSSNGTDLPFSRTPPATPTLKTEPVPPNDAISIDSLVEFFSREGEIDVVKDNAAGEGSDRRLSDWNADRVASAMALIRTMVSDSSIFYQESMKVYESCTRLHRDLSTEKRLREAQGLAISQQREKLAKANYLAESADQRVKEATESLLAEHANEKRRWSEERQRLFDNIERLTQDIKSLNSLDGGNHLQPLAPGTRSDDISRDVPRSVDHPAVGKIEPLTVEALPRDSELQDRIDILEGRVSELCVEIALAKQQLQAKIDENNVLQTGLNTLKANNEQLHFLESNIKDLRDTEQCLRNELSALESLKQDNAKLNRMLSEYENGTENSNLSSNCNARSFDYVGASGDKSLPGLTRSRSLTSLASLRDFSHTCFSGVQIKSDQQQRLFTANAQTMTESDIRPDNATTDEEVSQMLMAYSEKLVLKEDALHTREDELEAVRATAAELEGVLQDMLASIESSISSATNNNSHSIFAEHASPSSVSWSPAFSAQLKLGVRNRSASFFQGLRTNYLGMVDSSDMPSPTPRAQTDILRPASVSIASDILGPGSNPRDSGSASRQSSSGKHMFGASRTSGCNDVPLFVSSLLAMSHMAAAEVRKLMPYIYELENQSHNIRVELRKKEDQLSQLQKYCTLRSKHEDVVQEDIAHVLAQITRLRTKVVSLENEKKVCEEEVQQAQARCREAESQNIKQILQLIVGRVGKREWEKTRLSDDLSKKTAVDVPPNDGTDEPASQLRNLATASTVTISHPEAGDIRAEFNELLHQIIMRRDEDIERIQALADAWRIDARKALQLNEQRIWNTCTRGTQTAQTDHATIV
ncbi:hypothetical protein IWW48_004717 [Coemansia sp. RSA 1200]|nr:hypothetical protein IWW48_004717 [Coemansia sp. RSA 1200]